MPRVVANEALSSSAASAPASERLEAIRSRDHIGPANTRFVHESPGLSCWRGSPSIAVYALCSQPAALEACSATDVRLSRNAWWLYLAVMAPISVAYLAGPLNRGPVFNVIGFSAVVAIVVGVRLHKATPRLPWYLIALGQTFFVAGDVLSYNYTTFFGTALPFPSVADPLYLAVFPLTVAGLLLLIRQRNPGRDWASLVDAMIVTIGLALLSWVFLITPYAHDATLPLGTKLVSIGYPLGDILILGDRGTHGGRRGPAQPRLLHDDRGDRRAARHGLDLRLDLAARYVQPR